ncbi:MAG: PH domain-containing protein [Oscillospiraceae bacterium]|nr:PH domain-containing protein [Oscillospiraceae bacterium]MBQ3501062.1 PH domain-containing protein [Oscillospiraceae bacterium]MBQ4546035.1 PH domain-containing protein [Oscillospiraceae bacterium]MBQ4643271.1 PH domain-containing protein [Oscillospiraceae bacterium]
MAFVEKKRWLFLGLPFTFTKYTITEEQITINSGLFTRIENDCYMYKIQDTVLSVSLLQRIFGIATVVCKTSDVTHGQLVLKNIKNAKAIKDFIVECSEEQRLKRRTINTLNIDADVDGDLDGEL